MTVKIRLKPMRVKRIIVKEIATLLSPLKI